MQHVRALTLAVIALAPLSGCAGITEPASPGFEFSEHKVFGVRRSPPSPLGGDGFAEVTGIFEVPHSEFAVSGGLTLVGPRTLGFSVRGNPLSEGLQFPTLHLYRIRASRLPKGSYEIVLSYVVHKGALTDSTVAYTGSIQVR